MSGEGDSLSEKDCKDKDGSFEDNYLRQVKPLLPHSQRYKKNLLTNAKKSFNILEHQSLIDHLAADEEYIVSAGRDHDINIWDALEEKHIRRLSGHHAPVTGLSLFISGHSNFEKIIVSSSEDGSIRIWSLHKGEELNKIETGNVITCMGIMSKSLAVTGNNRGYMEVHHLRLGKLYTSISAHADPIDALEVEDNYACTATFEAPSCLKVWDIQFEQTRCIYRIENSPEIEFCCLTMWNKKLILGASNQQKLTVIDFVNEEKKSIDFKRPRGSVQTVKVWKEWIISCSIHKAQILLDVYRFHNYEYFGTFDLDVQQVKAIDAIKSENSLKIVIGGSSLQILSFDFILTDEEENLSFKRHKFTPLLNDCHDGNSTDSDEEDSEDDTFLNCDKIIGYTLQSNFEDIHFKQEDNEIDPISPTKIQTIYYSYHENKVPAPQFNFDGSHHVNTQNNNVKTGSPKVETKPTSPKIETQMLSFQNFVKRERISLDMRIFGPTRDVTEPRVAMRKLKEELDKSKLQEELKEVTKNNENDEDENDDIVILKDIFDIKLEKNTNENNIVEIIELEDDNDDDVHTKEIGDGITQHSKLNISVKETSITDQELAKRTSIKEEKVKNPLNDKKSSKNNKKCKKDKKKGSQKTKRKRCQIM